MASFEEVSQYTVVVSDDPGVTYHVPPITHIPHEDIKRYSPGKDVQMIFVPHKIGEDEWAGVLSRVNGGSPIDDNLFLSEYSEATNSLYKENIDLTGSPWKISVFSIFKASSRGNYDMLLWENTETGEKYATGYCWPAGGGIHPGLYDHRAHPAESRSAQIKLTIPPVASIDIADSSLQHVKEISPDEGVQCDLVVNSLDDGSTLVTLSVDGTFEDLPLAPSPDGGMLENTDPQLSNGLWSVEKVTHVQGKSGHLVTMHWIRDAAPDPTDPDKNRYITEFAY